MSSSFRTLKAAAAKIGATVVDESNGGRFNVYQVEAPTGYRWLNGPHAFRVEWLAGNPDSPAARTDAIADALQRMNDGFERCPASCECGEGAINEE